MAALSVAQAESANSVKRTSDFTNRFGLATFAGDLRCADGGAALAALITGIDLWQSFDGTGYHSGEYRLGQVPQQILC